MPVIITILVLFACLYFYGKGIQKGKIKVIENHPDYQEWVYEVQSCDECTINVFLYGMLCEEHELYGVKLAQRLRKELR